MRASGHIANVKAWNIFQDIWDYAEISGVIVISSMYDSDDHLQMRKGGCVNYDVTPHIIAHMYLLMRKGSAKVCEV